MMTALPNAFGVRFADLARWNPASFFAVQWQWPDEVIAPLSKALIRKTEAFTGKDEEAPPMATLHFDGSLVPRDLRGKKGTKGKLFRAQSGDVVYSKIDVRNGAIGIVPDVMPEIAVTSEFPVYRVHPEIALSEYVHLLFRTSAFRQQINSMISGASGRKRVEPSALEDLQVPLPPLATQWAILAQWHKARKAIAAAEERAKEIDGEIEAEVYRQLGVRVPGKNPVKKRVLGLSWSECVRWSVDSTWRIFNGLVGFEESRYPIAPMAESIDYTRNGFCIKPVAGPTQHKMLKLNSLTPEGLDTSASKFIRVSDTSVNATSSTSRTSCVSFRRAATVSFPRSS